MRDKANIDLKRTNELIMNKKLIIMRKNYFLLAAAVTMLTGCTNNDTLKDVLLEENETELIGFETFHNKSTKSAVSQPEHLTSDNGGFGVYGFKHLNDRTANESTKEIDLSDTNPNTPANNINYVSTIFDNVKVWYVKNEKTKDFTYEIPKYWDKQKFYTFFAYAPHVGKANAVADDPSTTDVDESADAVKGISFDQSKGLFTRNDIKKLQPANTYANSATCGKRQYSENASANITDYLIAQYVHSQKAGATNQPSSGQDGYYTGAELTVGFEFWHILSKLNVIVKAKNEDAGHKYKGIRDIQVKKLNITKLPNVPNDVTNTATYNQSKVTFTTTEDLNNAGSYEPTYYETNLEIIGNGTNATDAGPLFVLAGGTGTATSITSNPTEYINQSFHYYVAPNTPNTGDKHILNIDYEIAYVDGTIEPFSRTIDLSTATTSFTTMARNSV